MGVIYAIGGGKIEKKETFAIDERIVQNFTEKKPNILFIPTASYDSEKYYRLFKGIYEEKLKCIVDCLFLINNNITKCNIKDKIEKADIIYIGGGDTAKMINTWKQKNVLNLLIEAFHKNKIIAGLCAGAKYWFESALLQSFLPIDGDYKYYQIKGTGLIDGFFCPHYNDEKMNKNFKEFLKMNNKIGIALTDGCALMYDSDKGYEIINNSNESKAYLVYYSNGEIIENELIVGINYKKFNKEVTCKR